MERLADVVVVLEEIVAALDPELLDGGQASLLVQTFAKDERLCAAGRAIAAERVEATNAWKAEGYRSANEWLAAKTKSSTAAAKDTLKTAKKIKSLPATWKALVRGTVRAEQAAAIASAASVDPSSECRLLEEAEASSLRKLQRDAEAVRAAALRNQAESRDRVHRSRYLRTWTSKDGAFEGRFRLTNDHGAILAAALDIEHAQVFAQAKAEGRHETADAYNADALVNLARAALATDDEEQGDRGDDDCGGGGGGGGGGGDGGGGGRGEGGKGSDPKCSDSPPGRHRKVRPRAARSRPHAVLNIRVDYGALRRGWTEVGETCEIAGLGPTSVEHARHAAEDAFIRLHLYDGDHLIHVANAGRNMPAAMRRGLEHRDTTCCVPGCDAARHLEIHHLHAVSLGGCTSLANLCRICPYHHELVTNHGARITGRPRHWLWQPPTDRADGGSSPPAPPPGASDAGADPPEGSSDFEPVELRLL